jgi:hypothetical protein
VQAEQSLHRHDARTGRELLAQFRFGCHSCSLDYCSDTA